MQDDVVYYTPNNNNNNNNRLSGIKKYKDLRSCPPLGSSDPPAAPRPYTLVIATHNKVWIKPNTSGNDALPPSKKFSTLGTVNSISVTSPPTPTAPAGKKLVSVPVAKKFNSTTAAKKPISAAKESIPAAPFENEYISTASTTKKPILTSGYIYVADVKETASNLQSTATFNVNL